MSGIGFTLMDVAGGADNAILGQNPPPSTLGPEQAEPMPTDVIGTNALDHSMSTQIAYQGEEGGGTPIALYVLGAAALATIVYLIVK